MSRPDFDERLALSIAFLFRLRYAPVEHRRGVAQPVRALSSGGRGAKILVPTKRIYNRVLEKFIKLEKSRLDQSWTSEDELWRVLPRETVIGG